MNVSTHCIGLCLSRCGTCIPENRKGTAPPNYSLLCILVLIKSMSLIKQKLLEMF